MSEDRAAEPNIGNGQGDYSTLQYCCFWEGRQLLVQPWGVLPIQNTRSFSRPVGVWLGAMECGAHIGFPFDAEWRGVVEHHIWAL